MSTEPNRTTPAKDKPLTDKAVEDVIAGHPFLRGLKQAHLHLLAESAMRVHHRAGEIIFHEGEPANRFYLIEQGRVLLESPRREQLPVTLQVIGSGDVLGWSWLFPPFVWHFQARAVEPTNALVLDGAHLLVLCENDHELGFELMKRMTQVVIQRLHATRRQWLAREGVAIPA